MATFEVQVQGGNFYLQVPTDVEYLALDMLKRIVEDLHALTTLMEHGSICVKIDKPGRK